MKLIIPRNSLLLARMVTVCLCAMLFCLGCSTNSPETSRPHSVLVISDQEDGTSKVIRIAKAHDVARMEQFFPQYRSVPVSTNAAATWPIEYEIHFNFLSRSLYVLSDGERWTNDRGEFPVQGDLPGFLAIIGNEPQKE